MYEKPKSSFSRFRLAQSKRHSLGFSQKQIPYNDRSGLDINFENSEVSRQLLTPDSKNYSQQNIITKINAGHKFRDSHGKSEAEVNKMKIFD